MPMGNGLPTGVSTASSRHSGRRLGSELAPTAYATPQSPRPSTRRRGTYAPCSASADTRISEYSASMTTLGRTSRARFPDSLPKTPRHRLFHSSTVCLNSRIHLRSVFIFPRHLRQKCKCLGKMKTDLYLA
jgi:hypothetical protein